MKKYLLTKIIIFSLCFCISVQGESMTGATYILNASVNAITNGGQSGSPVGGENSSGAVYTIYTTPYGNGGATADGGGNSGDGQQPSTQASGGQGGSYGGEQGLQFVPTVLSNGNSSEGVGPDQNIDNQTSVEQVRQNEEKPFTFNDMFKFGQKTSTSTEADVDSSKQVNWSLVWIIILGIILLALRVWRAHHKNSLPSSGI